MGQLLIIFKELLPTDYEDYILLMKAYLINLDRSPDRLLHFEEQAAKFELTFKRVAAVDGRSDEIRSRAEQAEPGFSTAHIEPNEVACFESHRKVWNMIVSGSDRYGLVFEDDVVFSGGFGKVLNSDWIPENADIVKLETFFQEGYFDKLPATTIDNRDVLRVRSSLFGAAAYVISQEAASMLIKYTDEINDPVDEVMFNAKSHIFWKLQIFQLVPAPVVQGNLIYDNEKGWSLSTINKQAQSQMIGDKRKRRSYGLFSFVRWNRLLFKFRVLDYQRRKVDFL